MLPPGADLRDEPEARLPWSGRTREGEPHVACPHDSSRCQIILHWLIVVLIALQYVPHDPIQAAWRELRRGGTVARIEPAVAAHVLTVLLIGTPAVLRLWVRLRRGAPPLPENEPPLLELARMSGFTG